MNIKNCQEQILMLEITGLHMIVFICFSVTGVYVWYAHISS